jgi:hypothetical protein
VFLGERETEIPVVTPKQQIKQPEHDSTIPLVPEAVTAPSPKSV